MSPHHSQRQAKTHASGEGSGRHRSGSRACRQFGMASPSLVRPCLVFVVPYPVWFVCVTCFVLFRGIQSDRYFADGLSKPSRMRWSAFFSALLNLQKASKFKIDPATAIECIVRHYEQSHSVTVDSLLLAVDEGATRSDIVKEACDVAEWLTSLLKRPVFMLTSTLRRG